MKENVRYLWNWGLAFDEKRLLNRLEDLAEQGWLLDGMSTLRYRLRKGEPQALHFSMDYRKLKAEEEAEYFAVFAQAGWDHVCSLQGIHFFCANRDAVAIHTDRVTEMEKYSDYLKSSSRTMVISAVCFVLFFMLGEIKALSFLGRGENWAIVIALAASAAIFVPSLMMVFAYKSYMRKIEAEKN
ncbi:hypothetical protein SANA_02530 [Gottschalkiaceae bacterium SANA]|nr:hypothetical protein SANA_02530 [Gottschalkiaceae bacterium SANA]